MKLPRTNIGQAGSPPSKGGISGAGGYVLKRPSFREYYTGKRKPIKEDEEEEEKKEMSPLAKTAAAIGISVASLAAYIALFPEKAAKLGVTSIRTIDSVMGDAASELDNLDPSTPVLTPDEFDAIEKAGRINNPPTDIPALPQ